MEKDSFRTIYRKIRGDMDKDIRKEKSSIICSLILSSDIYKNCDTVLLYSPIGSEVDVMPIFYAALKDSKTVAFPRCIPENSQMDFYIVKTESELLKSYCGIKEPSADKYKLFYKNDDKVLCIVPALCVSDDGYRVGYGGGYYDRFLSRYDNIVSAVVCFEDCIADNIPHNQYDIRLKYIFTEKGLRDKVWTIKM